MSGLVIGKFYPLHRGHQDLIEFAIDELGEDPLGLTVLVCDSRGLYTPEIPAHERASWIRRLYPEVNVEVIPDIGDDPDPLLNSRRWAEHVAEFLHYVPEVVFTSEEYGKRFAHELHELQNQRAPSAIPWCEHVHFHDRVAGGISGTRCREDIWGCGDDIEPLVRASFVHRIAVVGAESTGTTTLTRALAEHYRTAWVPELGRVFSEGKQTSGEPWRREEFFTIATMQLELEDQLAETASRFLFCDTENLATALWYEHYLGRGSVELMRRAQQNLSRYICYIVTAPDIPWVQDGTRDGDLARRAKMHKRFLRDLSFFKKPYILVNGSVEQRVAQATKILDDLLAVTGPVRPAVGGRS